MDIFFDNKILERLNLPIVSEDLQIGKTLSKHNRRIMAQKTRLLRDLLDYVYQFNRVIIAHKSSLFIRVDES